MSTTNFGGKQKERFAWTLGGTPELVWKPSRRLRSIWGNPAEKEVELRWRRNWEFWSVAGPRRGSTA